MQPSTITSTLIPGGKTNLVLELPVPAIIRQYQQYNIDVKRFFGDLSVIRVYQCEQSGYRFFYPESIFGDDQFYRDLYANIPGYYHADRWEHHLSQGLVKSSDHVLEVGCGDGLFLERIKDRCASAVGLELNKNAIAQARSKGLNVLDELVQAHASTHPGTYDLVCYFQVLEHIYDVHSFIESSLKCLKKGGRLFIAVPNNNPYLHKRVKDYYLNIPPHHAGWWDKTSLLSLAGIFDLEVEGFYTEPLNDYKDWYQAQVTWHLENKPAVGALLKLVPRPLYKLFLKTFRRAIAGKNNLVVFVKK